MPRECVRCGHLTPDEAAEECEQCGSSRMRFSLLAGLRFDDSPSKRMVATIKKSALPTFFDRVSQSFMFMVWSAVAAFITAGAAFFALPEDAVNKQSLTLESLSIAETIYPMLVLCAIAAIPILATSAATVIVLRNVYLAQQMAAFLAPLASLMLLYGAMSLKLFVPVPVWVATPLAASFVAFIMGLRMAKMIRYSEVEGVEQIEYKVIDSWDRNAKGATRFLPSKNTNALNKLLFGVAMGFLAATVPPFALNMFLSQGSGAAVDTSTFAMWFSWIGVVVAGLAASSGSRSPIIQGMLAGALMMLTRVPSMDLTSKRTLAMMAIYVTVGAVGGYLGGLMFVPPKVIRGKRRDKRDEIKYDYDPAAVGNAPAQA